MSFSFHFRTLASNGLSSSSLLQAISNTLLGGRFHRFSFLNKALSDLSVKRASPLSPIESVSCIINGNPELHALYQHAFEQLEIFLVSYKQRCQSLRLIKSSRSVVVVINGQSFSPNFFFSRASAPVKNLFLLSTTLKSFLERKKRRGYNNEVPVIARRPDLFQTQNQSNDLLCIFTLSLSFSLLLNVFMIIIIIIVESIMIPFSP